MSEAYIGEIKMFAGSFAPRNWALANGQLLAISQNEAVFSLIGTFYGGDGRSTFALPDMRGRIPVSYGQGPGTQLWSIGQSVGTEEVFLTYDSLPSHTHTLQASLNAGDSGNPTDNVTAVVPKPFLFYKTATPPLRYMSPDVIGFTGGNPKHKDNEADAHSNMMPFQALTFIICIKGVFPSRN